MSVPGIAPAALAWAQAPVRGIAAARRVQRRLTDTSIALWHAVSNVRTTNDPQTCAEHLGALAEHLCGVHGLEIDLRGELPRAPAVLVCNHIGYFDPMVLLSLVPAMPIAKRELAGWPMIGAALEPLGVAMVQRGDPYDGARALRRAMTALQAGVDVLVFPEGTTTRGGSVLPLRRGIFGIASRLGVPVIPVVLQYDSPDAAWVGDDWFLPHYLRMSARPTTRVQVTFGDPIIARQQPNVFARFVRSRMIAMLARERRMQLVRAA